MRSMPLKWKNAMHFTADYRLKLHILKGMQQFSASTRCNFLVKKHVSRQDFLSQ